jgi:poly(3-hydroxybutyrate) depolymerase
MARQLGTVSFAVLLMLCSVAAAVQKGSEQPGEKAAVAAGADSKEVLIGGDANKRYFLVMPEGEKPAGGYKLLVVLPGGDGSADFQGFVKNIAAKGLPPGYIVAQAVAPKWSDAENRVVWPIAKLPDAKAKFTSEEFVEAIIADVKSKNAVNEKCVFTLGWSSGGPPCYSSALKEGSPVRGSFVAMSVFKPEQLPRLRMGRARRSTSCTRRRTSSRCRFRSRRGTSSRLRERRRSWPRTRVGTGGRGTCSETSGPAWTGWSLRRRSERVNVRPDSTAHA